MISVCMATYNGEKYLREQVDSILAQLGENDELVVSDDGSTDSTIDILKSYNDSRIKILKNKGNHGVNCNFDNALRYATGDYIFLADQDDIWLPDKIDECINALQKYDCVVHDAIVVDNMLNIMSNSFFEGDNSGRGFWKNIYKNTYLGCCMAFNRNVLTKILPIPVTKAFYHDGWIGCVADLRATLIFIPFKGILFRRHDNNTSCTAGKSKFSRFSQLKNRVIQLYYTAKNIIIQ